MIGGWNNISMRKISFLFLIILNNCIYTQEHFDEKVIYIILDRNLIKKSSLKINRGEISEIVIDSFEEKFVCKLKIFIA